MSDGAITAGNVSLNLDGQLRYPINSINYTPTVGGWGTSSIGYSDKFIVTVAGTYRCFLSVKEYSSNPQARFYHNSDIVLDLQDTDGTPNTATVDRTMAAGDEVYLHFYDATGACRGDLGISETSAQKWGFDPERKIGGTESAPSSFINPGYYALLEFGYAGYHTV